MSEAPLTLSTHRMRVTLLDVSPPVWRELHVPSAVNLGALHEIVQVCFGWENRHLHEWRIEDVTYGLSDEESWGEELEDESTAILGELAPADSSFAYTYDFGDGWEHLAEVLAIEPFGPMVIPVVCLDGAGACPPEDCGGPFGYEHLIDAISDPDDPEHDAWVELVGDRFDPLYFDRESVNVRLEAFWRPDLDGELLEPAEEDDDDAEDGW